MQQAVEAAAIEACADQDHPPATDQCLLACRCRPNQHWKVLVVCWSACYTDTHEKPYHTPHAGPHPPHKFYTSPGETLVKK